MHKPKCVAVRNISKEHRKLIKNWNLAKKEGSGGCKLCSSHIKPKVLVHGKINYKFVASKDSDKVHTAACSLVSNIYSNERVFFRTYKAVLKKGYTACRVCNPQ